MWKTHLYNLAAEALSGEEDFRSPRRMLLQASSESSRIFGIGIGAFTVLVLCLLSCLICWLGSNTRNPGVVAVSTTFILGILLLILFFSPRGTDSEEVDFEGYDTNFIPRVAVMVMVDVGAFVGLVCILIHFVVPKRQARALNYQRDVLMKY